MALDILLATARRVIDAAGDAAMRLGILVSIAVVDDGGNLKAFVRMDGAELAGIDLARDKAYTSVANSIATHDLARLAQPGADLFGIQANAGGRYVIFGGGVPLLRDGRVVGAIGVSGGTASQDVECAEAGATAWCEHIRTDDPRPE
jgi:uncharacterized protein GlcG (DUF336 family)